jgi:hypothetical protein
MVCVTVRMMVRAVVCAITPLAGTMGAIEGEYSSIGLAVITEPHGSRPSGLSCGFQPSQVEKTFGACARHDNAGGVP